MPNARARQFGGRKVGSTPSGRTHVFAEQVRVKEGSQAAGGGGADAQGGAGAYQNPLQLSSFKLICNHINRHFVLFQLPQPKLRLKSARIVVPVLQTILKNPNLRHSDIRL